MAQRPGLGADTRVALNTAMQLEIEADPEFFTLLAPPAQSPTIGIYLPRVDGEGPDVQIAKLQRLAPNGRRDSARRVDELAISNDSMSLTPLSTRQS